MVFSENLHPRDLHGRFIDVSLSPRAKWLKITDNKTGIATYVPKDNFALVRDYLHGRLPADRVKVGPKRTNVKSAEDPSLTEFWLRNDQIEILKALDRDGHFNEGVGDASTSPDSPDSPDSPVEDVWDVQGLEIRPEIVRPGDHVAYLKREGNRYVDTRGVVSTVEPDTDEADKIWGYRIGFEDGEKTYVAPDKGVILHTKDDISDRFVPLTPADRVASGDLDSREEVLSGLSDEELDQAIAGLEGRDEIALAQAKAERDSRVPHDEDSPGPLPDDVVSAADTAPSDDSQVPDLPEEVSVSTASPEVQRLNGLPPVDFDDELAGKYGELYGFADTRDKLQGYIANEVSRAIGKPRARNGYDTIPATDAEIGVYVADGKASPSILSQIARRDQAAADYATKSAEIQVYDEVYRDRGMWNRAYLVENGHVHRRMSCSTCFPSTRFDWRTEFSDKTEEEIVDAAGDRACTVCYPSAPVEVLNRPTRIFTEAEMGKARVQQERDAKRAEKDAAKFTVPGYTEFGSRGPQTKTFNTVRGATNALSSDLSSLLHYGETHPSAPSWLANIRAIMAALEARGEDYDFAKVLANARKKIEREGETPRWDGNI